MAGSHLKNAGEEPASLPPESTAEGPVPQMHESEIEVPAALYDVVICGVLAALGLWFVFYALRMPTSDAAFDPGTFPMIAGGLLVVLAGLQIALALAGKGARGVVGFQRPLWLAIGMVLVMVFPFAVGAFGYYLVTVIWVPVFGWVAGVRRPLSLLATTAIVLLLAKGVFEMLLGTPLP